MTALESPCQPQCKKKFTVAAGAATNIDSAPLAGGVSRKYFIDFAIPSEDRYRAVEMFTSRQGTSVTDNVYARLGDAIDVSLNFVVIGADGVVQVVNNELVPVTITIFKI